MPIASTYRGVYEDAYSEVLQIVFGQFSVSDTPTQVVPSRSAWRGATFKVAANQESCALVDEDSQTFSDGFVLAPGEMVSMKVPPHKDVWVVSDSSLTSILYVAEEW